MAEQLLDGHRVIDQRQVAAGSSRAVPSSRSAPDSTRLITARAVSPCAACDGDLCRACQRQTVPAIRKAVGCVRNNGTAYVDADGTGEPPAASSWISPAAPDISHRNASMRSPRCGRPDP
jgi:hypothetical protein